MELYRFSLATLAVWRITHLLSEEDGPWDMFGRLRRIAGESLAGGILNCFYCLSLWVALPIALGLGLGWKEKLLLWPALSASGIFLERLMRRWQATEPSPAAFFETPFATPSETSEALPEALEDPDVMLRS